MLARSLLLTASLLATLPTPARSQTADIALPTLTDQQKWNRLEFHWATLAAGAVAYARTKGEDVQAVSHILGKLFAPSWSDTLSPVALARGIYINGAAWKDFQFQVVTATEASATVRFNRPWVPDFGKKGNMYGMTPDDVDTLLGIVYQEIATAHGIVYDQHRDGDYVVATIRRR